MANFKIPSEIYEKITGTIVMIGFGSIGRGTLPLLERHFEFDKSRVVVIDPSDKYKDILDKMGIQFLQVTLNEDNYQDILTPLFSGEGKSCCINLSINVSSLDVMKFCRNLGVFYIDTVVEPWSGFYFDNKKGAAKRSNYFLREEILEEKKNNPGGITAVSCCGANPGMVSWLVKQALLNLAKDLNRQYELPKTRQSWAQLMSDLGVKGVHIAERDTQGSKRPKPMNYFVNSWSVDGFISEGMQPVELGWGTHEKWFPDTGGKHEDGCLAAIYLNQPGASTKVRTWCPTPGAQFGRIVTHNESISIADYFTLGDPKNPIFRPTCHYAYHPCNDACLSLDEMFGRGGKRQSESHILDEGEIVDGVNELGVLLYGHPKNAYWYGSQLSIEQTRAIAPYQNATGLQVSSAVIAGIAWMLENPESGIVEADEMDFQRCLEFQLPYLGSVRGYYTDWNPLTDRHDLFPEDVDTQDPWQFKNVLVRM